MPRKYGSKALKVGKAPLVQTDINELGDKRLNETEVVAREREELLKIESKKKCWRQEELEDIERSGGTRIQPGDFLFRLKKCNPAIQVRDGVKGTPGTADSVALYVCKKSSEYTEADFRHDEYRPKDEFFVHHKYVGGFPFRPLQEWASVSVDTSHVAVREYRGWRSVLISLIKAGAITYEAAVKEFGDPRFDQRNGLWMEQVYRYIQQ